MIYSIQKLKLNDDLKQKLVASAEPHKQQGNIWFTITHVTKSAVYIKVSQGFHVSENYSSETTLEELANELFKDYVDSRAIFINAKAYSPADDEMPTIPVRYKDGLIDRHKNSCRINDGGDTMEDI